MGEYKENLKNYSKDAQLRKQAIVTLESVSYFLEEGKVSKLREER